MAIKAAQGCTPVKTSDSHPPVGIPCYRPNVNKPYTHTRTTHSRQAEYRVQGLGFIVEGLPKLGVPFGGPNKRGCNELGSILGSPYLGKLPQAAVPASQWRARWLQIEGCVLEDPINLMVLSRD